MCKHRFLLRCDCGCSVLEFDKIDDGDNNKIIYVSYYINAFYEKKPKFFHRLFEKIKAVYYIISGKEYQLYEIVIVDPVEMAKFDCFLGEVSKNTAVQEDC